jgi:hypothetical protein
MRIALVIVMAITQLAGPWLCCCGPERASAGAPIHERSGCPHCQKEPPPPTDHDRQPPCGPDRCPFGGMTTVFVPADKPEPVFAADLLVPLLVALPQQVEAGSVTAQAVSGLREVPHLTASDRLFAHHVLRC